MKRKAPGDGDANDTPLSCERTSCYIDFFSTSGAVSDFFTDSWKHEEYVLETTFLAFPSSSFGQSTASCPNMSKRGGAQPSPVSPRSSVVDLFGLAENRRVLLVGEGIEQIFFIHFQAPYGSICWFMLIHMGHMDPYGFSRCFSMLFCLQLCWEKLKSWRKLVFRCIDFQAHHQVHPDAWSKSFFSILVQSFFNLFHVAMVALNRAMSEMFSGRLRCYKSPY